jgi:CRP-like cAMP-binding protein
MSRNILALTLEEIGFLRGMAPEHLEKVANIASIHDFDDDDIVFREGDAAEYLYLVASGTVSLEVCAAGVGCKQILTVGAGELLGWSSLLGQSRYTARATTPQAARLVRLNVAQVMKLCDADPHFGYDLMRRTALALAKRLSATRIQLLNVYGDQLPITSQATEAR